MPLALALPAEFRVQLAGDGGDQRRRPGDVRLLELRNIPVQQGHIRVQLLAAHGGIVLHRHLLLQQEAHKY